MLKPATSVRLLSASLILVMVMLAASALQPSAATAQVVERGVQGGVAGAIIGGIIGGGRGAGTGAAIGAGVGIISGAAEADANARARAAYAQPYYGPPAGPPGNIVYDTQASLTRLGYDPGPVDGVFGQRTADAISQFQVYNHLPVDGRPSPGLLNLMIQQGG